ncbi:MAG: hypothetical protein N3H30_00845 [Candidatus Micrarchaeota archaeon]|nr:hypothetical protein [Candidatus Micrarchaeota archaeon]
MAQAQKEQEEKRGELKTIPVKAQGEALTKDEVLRFQGEGIVIPRAYMERALREFRETGNFLDSFRKLILGAGLNSEDVLAVYLEVYNRVSRGEPDEIYIRLAGVEREITINFTVDTSVKSVEGTMSQLLNMFRNEEITLTEKAKKYTKGDYEKEYGKCGKLNDEVERLKQEISKSGIEGERKLRYFEFLQAAKTNDSWAWLKIGRDIFEACKKETAGGTIRTDTMYSLADMIGGLVQLQTGAFIVDRGVMAGATFGGTGLGETYFQVGYGASETVSGTGKSLYGGSVAGTVDVAGKVGLSASVTLGGLISGTVPIIGNGGFGFGLTTVQLFKEGKRWDVLLGMGRMGGMEGVMKIPLSALRETPWVLAITAGMSLIESTAKAIDATPTTLSGMLAFGVIANMAYPAPIYNLYEVIALIDYIFPDKKKEGVAFYENYENIIKALYLLSIGKTNPGLSKIDGVLASSKGAVRGYALAVEDCGIVQELWHGRIGEKLIPTEAIKSRIEEHMKRLSKISEITPKNKYEFFESYTYLITKLAPHITGDKQVFPLYFRDEKTLFAYFELMASATELLCGYSIETVKKNWVDKELQAALFFARGATVNPYAKIAMAYDELEQKTGKVVSHPQKLNYIQGIAMATCGRLNALYYDKEYDPQVTLASEALEYIASQKGLQVTSRTLNKFFAQFMDVSALANMAENSQVYMMASALKALKGRISDEDYQYYEKMVIEWMQKNYEVWNVTGLRRGKGRREIGEKELVFSLPQEIKILNRLLEKQREEVESLRDDIIDYTERLEVPDGDKLLRGVKSPFAKDIVYAAVRDIEGYSEEVVTSLSKMGKLTVTVHKDEKGEIITSTFEGGDRAEAVNSIINSTYKLYEKLQTYISQLESLPEPERKEVEDVIDELKSMVRRRIGKDLTDISSKAQALQRNFAQMMQLEQSIILANDLYTKSLGEDVRVPEIKPSENVAHIIEQYLETEQKTPRNRKKYPLDEF